MFRPQAKWIALSVALCASAACSQTPGTPVPGRSNGADAVAISAPDGGSDTKSRPAAAIDAKAFCTKLRPAIQPLVKPALALHRADDSTTDSNHTGEPQYVDCDFRQQRAQVDVSLHDDSDHTLFDDSNEKGYAPLAGFGDAARYSVQGAMGMRWVDVVRGSTACETRMTMEDEQINGDWKQAAGKMCDGAFAAR